MKSDLIFLDTETTGVEGRLIQLAYKKSGDQNVFVQNYKPLIPIEIEAMATHHITERMVAHKTPFSLSEDHKKVSELLRDAILVAHNARFDLGMLEKEGIMTDSYICTWRVAQTLYDYPQYKMQYLRYLWDIDIPEAQAHSAAGDVMVLEEVFNHMMRDYKNIHNATDEKALQDFMDISRKPLLMRRPNFGKYAGKTFEEIKAIDASYLRWMATLTEKGEDWIYSVNYYLNNLL